MTALRGAIGIGISVVCVYLLLREVDPARVGVELARADPALVVLAVVATAVDVLLRARRWQVLLARVRQVPFGPVLRYLSVGYLVNNVLPARVGEVARSHYLGDREGFSRATAFGTVLVERVVDTAVVALLAGASVALLDVGPVLRIGAAIGVALAVALALVLALALVAHAAPGADLVRRILAARPSIRSIVARLREGLAVVAHRQTLTSAVLLSLASWAAGIVSFAAAARAVGVHLDPLQAVALTAVVSLATVIPSGPGYLGPFELAAVRVLGAFGVASETAFAAALLAHVVVLVTTSLAGAVSLVRLSVGSRGRHVPDDQGSVAS
jgi:glycosyltransferase 2 family protein